MVLIFVIKTKLKQKQPKLVIINIHYTVHRYLKCIVTVIYTYKTYL